MSDRDMYLSKGISEKCNQVLFSRIYIQTNIAKRRNITFIGSYWKINLWWYLILMAVNVWQSQGSFSTIFTVLKVSTVFRGGGGVWKPPNLAYKICEQPLILILQRCLPINMNTISVAVFQHWVHSMLSVWRSIALRKNWFPSMSYILR